MEAIEREQADAIYMAAVCDYARRWGLLTKTYYGNSVYYDVSFSGDIQVVENAACADSGWHLVFGRDVMGELLGVGMDCWEGRTWHPLRRSPPHISLEVCQRYWQQVLVFSDVVLVGSLAQPTFSLMPADSAGQIWSVVIGVM